MTCPMLSIVLGLWVGVALAGCAGLGTLPEDVVQRIDAIHQRFVFADMDHIGIGSDLRGGRYYTIGFGSRGNFNAITASLLKRGYSDEEVGKIMGHNFFRAWQTVTAKQTS